MKLKGPTEAEAARKATLEVNIQTAAMMEGIFRVNFRLKPMEKRNQKADTQPDPMLGDIQKTNIQKTDIQTGYMKGNI